MAAVVVSQAEQIVRQAYVQWAINAINASAEDYLKYENYYLGDHALEFATDRWRDIFGNEFESFSDNWTQVVVDSMIQRLEITGWRVDDQDKSTDAEDIWDDNNLEVEEDALHTQTAVKGDGYLIVWKNPEDPTKVDIFFNDAKDVAVTYSGSNKRKIIRAAKRYTDDKKQQWLILYFPDRIETWYVPNNYPDHMLWAVMNETVEGVPEGWVSEEVISNPYGRVPVFHFQNRALGFTHGVSELKAVVPVQNAVNKLLMDLMVASEFGSYKQKWMAGAGHPKGGWKAGPERMWATTDNQAKFGSFDETDLEPLVRAIDLVVGHIAKITQTPLHYLRSSGDMPSGEALKTAESGMVKKCIARQKQWGATWAEAMTFAVWVKTGEKPDKLVKPVWKSPETRHDLEQGQVAQLKSILGIPLEILWAEHFGYSEEQIENFKELNKAVAASVLARVIGQIGQLPPGTDQIGTTPEQLIELLKSDPESKGNASTGEGLDLSQILALLPKGTTGQTTAGEATTRPQPHTSPPGSPTRRGSGFKD